MRNLFILLAATCLISAPAFASQPITYIGDCSITSLTGSASQQILAANPQRKYLQIFNPAASDAIYVNLSGGTAGATATSTGTLKIAAQGNVTFVGGPGNVVPANAITVNGTAADAVICLEGR